MNHYRTTLKEVLFTFGVDGPRHAEMPKDKDENKRNKGKKSRQADSDDNIIFKRDIWLLVYLGEEENWNETKILGEFQIVSSP